MARGFFVSRGVALHTIDQLAARIGQTSGFRFHESLTNARLSPHTHPFTVPMLRQEARIWVERDGEAGKKVFGRSLYPSSDELAFVSDDLGLIAWAGYLPRALYEANKRGQLRDKFWKDDHFEEELYDDVCFADAKWNRWRLNKSVDYQLTGKMVKEGLYWAGATATTTGMVDRYIQLEASPGLAASVQVHATVNPLFGQAATPAAPSARLAGLRARGVM